MKQETDAQGRFVKGSVPFNKGKTWEESIGRELARKVKLDMSEKAKTPTRKERLAKMNSDPEFLRKRAISRAYHDEVVGDISNILRERGDRIYVLSSYVNDAIPDIIIFKNGKLYAIELEQEKIWKPSMETMAKRKRNAHKKHNFFDEVVLVPFNGETNIYKLIDYIDRLE
jgi:hypothetical protein